jgi:DNA polymerase III subunit gamma/tau
MAKSTEQQTTYVVTALKWRPMVFADIVGQSHITTTLQNAIASKRLSHAYIFSGARGIGKTTAARILARAINCLHPNGSDPDNTCDVCKEMIEGRSVNIFEIDGASNNSVDDIRNLRDAVRYGPAKGNYKVYIIDEVHMLSKGAFNALLKTLEEPPPYVMFIFATTEIHKVPLTILSRCQRFDFRRITIDEIISQIKFIAGKEQIKIDDEALHIIARRADGSMRDAQSIFDQIVSYCGKDVKTDAIISMLGVVDYEIFFRVTDSIKVKDIKAGLSLVEEIINRGYDIREFLNGLIEHLRHILVAQVTDSTVMIELSDLYRARYQSLKGTFTDNDLLRLIKVASDTESAIKWVQQPRLKLEIALINMIKMDSSVDISSLIGTIEEIQNNVTNGKSDVTGRSGRFEGTDSSKPPIKGSVKASPPTLAPHQVVQMQQPPITLGTATEINETPRFSISADPLKKWSMFVGEALRERVYIGMMLNQTSLLEAEENRLCIGCPDDFHLNELNMKKTRQYLQELAQKIYGAKMQLETIISSRRQQSVSEKSEASNQSTLQQHPLVQTLIREFGAKPISR